MKNSLTAGMEKSCKFTPPQIELHFDWCRSTLRLDAVGDLDFDVLHRAVADAEVSLDNLSDRFSTSIATIDTSV